MIESEATKGCKQIGRKVTHCFVRTAGRRRNKPGLPKHFLAVATGFPTALEHFLNVPAPFLRPFSPFPSLRGSFPEAPGNVRKLPSPFRNGRGVLPGLRAPFLERWGDVRKLPSPFRNGPGALLGLRAPFPNGRGNLPNRPGKLKKQAKFNKKPIKSL
ncbi:MAG: hypothetical protein ABSG87_04250 [Verrucomicrobiota bacterium]|jgi:hypothetical protein